MRKKVRLELIISLVICFAIGAIATLLWNHFIRDQFSYDILVLIILYAFIIPAASIRAFNLINKIKDDDDDDD